MSRRRPRARTRIVPTTAGAPARNGRGRLGPIRLGPARDSLAFTGLRSFARRHPVLVSLLVYGVVVALLRPATWYTPLFEDPAQNLYVGQAIFDGGAPYVDAANNKGPLTHLLFGFLGLIAGTSNFVLKLAVVAVTPVAALLVAAYVSRYADRAVGFLAGLAFALFSSTGDLLGFEPMTEVFGMLPMTAAWYLASRGSSRSAAGAGVCAAVATLMNPAFAIVIPIAGLELWRQGRERGTRAILIAWAVAGAANTTAAVMIWLGLAGAIDDMLTQVLGHATNAVDAGPAPESSLAFSEDASTLYRFLTIPAGTLWIAATIGSILAWRTPRLRPLAVPALLWLGLTFARVKVADYELYHQFYLALPGIALGFAAGIASFWGAASRQRVALAALVLAAPVATLVLGPQWRALQREPSERFGVGNSYALAEPVADFIRSNTSPRERIFAAGHNAQVYWLSERKAPTRFFDSFPLEHEASYRRERNRDLQESPPKAIVIMPDTPPDTFVRDLITRLRYQLAFEERGARVYLRF
jgi:hypothetical protein